MTAMDDDQGGQAYSEILLTYPDRRDWVLGRVLEDRAATQPDRPFLQWEDEAPLSFGAVNGIVNRLAHGLASAGLQKGERVMILLPNCLEYVLAWFALAKLGAVEVPVNTHYRGDFLQHVANNCQARMIVTGPAFLDALAEAEAGLSFLQAAYVVGPAGQAPAFNRVQLHGFGVLLDADDSNPLVAVGYTDIAAILFTSGTTGPSKGVLMPHAQMYFFAEQGASLVRLGQDDVYMNPFPLFHGNAQFLTVYPCLIRGALAVLYERFSASDWIGRARRNRVTVTNLLGVTMDFIHGQPAQPDDADNRLRLVYAVPTADAILPVFQRRFGIDRFVNAFGQTETCWSLMTPFDEVQPPGAVGKLVADWFEARLVDPDTDEEVAAGQMGELVVRAKQPWTMSAGYNGSPEASARAMRNLWWHTGDGLRRDAQGWFYFVDRVNDALRVGGENVSSYEVEQVALAHPAVAACAAVGIRGEGAGGEHDIKLCVVAQDGLAIDAEALIRFFEKRAPFFAVPRYIEIVSALPRTASEKIQKHLLRSAGVGSATWDRRAAGVLLEHEARRSSRPLERGST